MILGNSIKDIVKDEINSMWASMQKIKDSLIIEDIRIYIWDNIRVMMGNFEINISEIR